MNIEQSVADRALVHAALGDPVRLAIVDRLVSGDASPGELGAELAVPSNLLAHHLKLLERAGVLTRTRSEGDHRRTYLRLRGGSLTGLSPVARHRAPRVVFVCTRNSARSQLAGVLWKRRSRVPAVSAGTEPAARVHPLAIATARAHGLALGRARTADLRQVLRPGDLVVAVCDNAHEHLDRAMARLHWSVPDPAPVDSEAAFEQALADLADRIDRLAPTVHPVQERP